MWGGAHIKSNALLETGVGINHGERNSGQMNGMSFWYSGCGGLSLSIASLRCRARGRDAWRRLRALPRPSRTHTHHRHRRSRCAGLLAACRAHARCIAGGWLGVRTTHEDIDTIQLLLSNGGPEGAATGLLALPWLRLAPLSALRTCALASFSEILCSPGCGCWYARRACKNYSTK